MQKRLNTLNLAYKTKLLQCTLVCK